MRNYTLDLFAIKFIDEHYDKLPLHKIDLENKTKEDIIRSINDDDTMSSWIISEVMVWVGDKDYTEEIRVENEDGGFVVKIDDKYFSVDYEATMNDREYLVEVYPKEVVRLIFTKEPNLTQTK